MKAHFPPDWNHYGMAYVAQAFPELHNAPPNRPPRPSDSEDNGDTPNIARARAILRQMRDFTPAEEHHVIFRFSERLRQNREELKRISRNIGAARDTNVLGQVVVPSDEAPNIRPNSNSDQVLGAIPESKLDIAVTSHVIDTEMVTDVVKDEKMTIHRKHSKSVSRFANNSQPVVQFGRKYGKGVKTDNRETLEMTTKLEKAIKKRSKKDTTKDVEVEGDGIATIAKDYAGRSVSRTGANTRRRRERRGEKPSGCRRQSHKLSRSESNGEACDGVRHPLHGESLDHRRSGSHGPIGNIGRREAPLDSWDEVRDVSRYDGCGESRYVASDHRPDPSHQEHREGEPNVGRRDDSAHLRHYVSHRDIHKGGRSLDHDARRRDGLDESRRSGRDESRRDMHDETTRLSRAEDCRDRSDRDPRDNVGESRCNSGDKARHFVLGDGRRREDRDGGNRDSHGEYRRDVSDGIHRESRGNGRDACRSQERYGGRNQGRRRSRSGDK